MYNMGVKPYPRQKEIFFKENMDKNSFIYYTSLLKMQSNFTKILK